MVNKYLPAVEVIRQSENALYESMKAVFEHYGPGDDQPNFLLMYESIRTLLSQSGIDFEAASADDPLLGRLAMEGEVLQLLGAKEDFESDEVSDVIQTVSGRVAALIAQPQGLVKRGIDELALRTLAMMLNAQRAEGRGAEYEESPIDILRVAYAFMVHTLGDAIVQPGSVTEVLTPDIYLDHEGKRNDVAAGVIEFMIEQNFLQVAFDAFFYKMSFERLCLTFKSFDVTRFGSAIGMLNFVDKLRKYHPGWTVETDDRMCDYLLAHNDADQEESAQFRVMFERTTDLVFDVVDDFMANCSEDSRFEKIVSILKEFPIRLDEYAYFSALSQKMSELRSGLSKSEEALLGFFIGMITSTQKLYVLEANDFKGASSSDFSFPTSYAGHLVSLLNRPVEVVTGFIEQAVG